jgi:hypothetical protein
MNWDECKQLFKEEWEFHTRHPEMLFVWLTYLVSVIYAFTQ